MRFIFKFLIPLVLIVSSAIAFYVYNEFESFKSSTLAKEVTSFEIKKGSNIRTVARTLQNKNIIQNKGPIEPKWLFIGLAKITKQDRKLKAGEYFLKQGSTPNQMLDLFSSGKTIQYQTRIPEGFNFKQIIEIIKSDENLKQTLSDDDYKNIMSILKTKYQHHQPEGWFLPDTYSYPRGTTDLQFLQRSHDAMLKELDKHWQDRRVFKGIKKPYDALILASIIEKETGASFERPIISSVFHNRLKKGMRLEADPTVIYGLKNFNGNLTRKHLTTWSPYNTYKIKGLPIGPIACPGASAIEAALYPADTGFIFFVSKRDTTHKFTTNLKDHNKAIRKYQLRR